MPTPIRRSGADACPGALRLHPAADGPLARVRIPGGALSGAQLALLADLATRYGDGALELTSRANVQLRALLRADPAGLATKLAAAGLLPSPTHELVRNIAAPPLADPTLRTLVADLDRALCADSASAALPGRFLFAIGRVALDADLAAVPVGHHFTILFAGQDLGLEVPPSAVVPTLLTAARTFLEHRATTSPPVWRLAELPTGPAPIAAQTAATLGLPAPGPPTPTTAANPSTPTEAGSVTPTTPSTGGTTPPPHAAPEVGREHAPLVGAVQQGDGRVAVGALVPLGRLTSRATAVLARAERLVLTPWRGVLVPGLSPHEAAGWAEALAEAGLPVAAGSRWSGVTACAGRPGCAKSLADVRADAEAATRYADGLPVHWIGCARGCGAPAAPHVRVEATPDGWTVSGPDGRAVRVPDHRTAGAPGGATEVAGADRLAEIVAAARRRM